MVTPEESSKIPHPVQMPYHELQLVSSEVRGLRIDAFYPTKGEEAEKQPVMCDFEIVRHDTALARFFVSLLLEMENNRKVDNALSFSISSVTEFEFRPSAVATPLPEDERLRWHLFSLAVATAVSMTRGHLTNYLAPTAYRGYYLPMVNVQQLVDKRYAPTALPEVPSTAPSEKPSIKPKKAKE